MSHLLKFVSLFFILCSAHTEVQAERRNILYVLLDDFGWADAGWHRPAGSQDLQTPNMDLLVREGVELDRHYVYMFCSPTRSAVQSGRNPIHVNVLNMRPTVHNENDKVSGFAGIPRNMTGMAEHMLRADYETHMYGKWDAGMATPEHTPYGRGYETSLHYFFHENDYWTSQTPESCSTAKGQNNSAWPDGVNNSDGLVDLWDTQSPAKGQNNSASCSQEQQEGCIYEDQLFANRVLAAIQGRNPAKPFFIFWAPHSVHVPYQVPNDALERFSFIIDENRQYYHAMAYFVDKLIGRVTEKLKAHDLWNQTLIVVHTDNGGPIVDKMDRAGANNFPLKGGKSSNWDGGIRAAAFVSGGFLPAKVRGTKQTGLTAAWDWYATFAALAGVDPTDVRAAKAELPPIESYNLWPLISAQTKISPRQEVAIGEPGPYGEHGLAVTIVGGLIWNRHKLLLGNVSQAVWTGPVYPNNPPPKWDPTQVFESCGDEPRTGCLYDIFNDPQERINIAHQEPYIFQKMLSRVRELQQNVFSPVRGATHPAACHYALTVYGGFWGPFVDVQDSAIGSHLHKDEALVV